MKRTNGGKLLLAIAASGVLAACSTPTPGTIDKLAMKVPRVENSPGAPCWQQRQIAKQNAYLDAVAKGKARAYHAPCDVKKQKPATAEPKTS